MPTTWLVSIIGIFVAVAYGLIVWQRERLTNAHVFLDECKAELKKVTWPGRTEVTTTTWIVIITVFFFGTYLSIIDSVVSFAREALYAAVGVGGPTPL